MLAIGEMQLRDPRDVYLLGIQLDPKFDLVSGNYVRATFARNQGPVAADARRGEDDVEFGRRNGRR